MQNNTFSIAVLGAGNIGSAVLTRLQELDDKVLKLDLKKVLVSDISKERGVSKDLLTDNFDDILNDDSIDLVIEVLGGVDPGKEYIKSLLEKGKAVITANKDAVNNFVNASNLPNAMVAATVTPPIINRLPINLFLNK